MRLGLVYLPDESVRTRLTTYAEELVGGLEARMVVGDARLPHVTLAHVETDAPPEELWREATRAVPTTLPLTCAALGFLRYDRPYNAPPAPPATMAWVLVHATDSLRRAEQGTTELPFVRAAQVTTAQGDRFMPHFTLAIWEGEVLPRRAELPAPVFDGAAFEVRLALGIIGANGTYVRSLFEA